MVATNLPLEILSSENTLINRKKNPCILLLQISVALINVELTVIQYDNPLGTSYSGDNTKGDRKCCDVGGDSCSTGNDTCDVYFLFCIGE